MKKVVFPLQQDLKMKIANDGYTLYPSEEFGLTYRLSNVDLINKTLLLEFWIIDMSNNQIVRKIVDYYVTENGFQSKLPINEAEILDNKNILMNLIEKRKRLEDMLNSNDESIDLKKIQDKLFEINNEISNFKMPQAKHLNWFKFDDVINYFDKFILTDEGLSMVYNLEFNGYYIGDYIAKRI